MPVRPRAAGRAGVLAAAVLLLLMPATARASVMTIHDLDGTGLTIDVDGNFASSQINVISNAGGFVHFTFTSAVARNFDVPLPAFGVSAMTYFLILFEPPTVIDNRTFLDHYDDSPKSDLLVLRVDNYSAIFDAKFYSGAAVFPTLTELFDLFGGGEGLNVGFNLAPGSLSLNDGIDTFVVVESNVEAVPEPATATLLGTGLLAIARRRRSQAAASR